MGTRRAGWGPLLLLLPVLLCGCCGWALFGSAVQLALGQTPLTFFGTPATGTIDAVLPCRSSVKLSGDESNPGAFSFNFNSSGGGGNTVRVRYTDAGGHERIGQTVACTDLGSTTVGDFIGVVYRDGDPSAILLQKDRPLYRTVATWSAIAIGVALLAVLLVVLPWRPAVSRGPVDIRALSLAAVGPNNYATLRIGLKEALLLLHLRRTNDPLSDTPDFYENPKLLYNHMVLAAMLMELVAGGRIEVREGRGLTARGRASRGHIVVLDPSPVGEPDLDELLRELAGQRADVPLDRFYRVHGRRTRVARLIEQLRQGGYVRLHEPQTGFYGPQRRSRAQSPLGQWLGAALGPIAFNSGTVVADDSYQFAYPWKLLYTTHTEAEERLFERVQTAIASRGAGDDFTRRLLILVAALHVARNMFPQRYATAKSLYRFYPPEQRWEIIRFVRELARAAPPSEQAIFNEASQIDYLIENAPSGG